MCGRRFKQRGRLETHLNTVHIGLRPYQIGHTEDVLQEPIYSNARFHTEATNDLNDFNIDEMFSFNSTTVNFDRQDQPAPNVPIPVDTDEFSETSVITYVGAGAPITDYEPTEEEVRWMEQFTAGNDPGIAPFKSRQVFNLARWITLHDIPVKAVNELLGKKSDMPLFPEVYEEISSAYTLRKKVAEIHDGIGDNWTTFTTDINWNNSSDNGKVSWRQRDLESTLKWFLRQPYLKEHLVFAPVKVMENVNRVYSELHTADWWWEVQVSITTLPIKKLY